MRKKLPHSPVTCVITFRIFKYRNEMAISENTQKGYIASIGVSGHA